MNWLKENWFKLAIIGILLLIAYPFYYYYVIYIPDRDQRKRDQEIADQANETWAKELAEDQRNQCLLAAEIAYDDFWTRECEHAGINHKNEGCNLPFSNADRVSKARDEQKDECFKKYPVN